MVHDIDRVLLTQTQIHQRVCEMAADIGRDYAERGGGLTIVPILSGSIIFLADLIREMPLKMKIALIQISAYPGATTVGQDPRTVLNLTGDVRGRHVLLLDDILDSGRTLRRVQGMIREHEPASLRTGVLLRKPSKAPADVKVEYVGFDIEDQFVVGYGLDFDDHYRNYPHLGVLRPELMPCPTDTSH